MHSIHRLLTKPIFKFIKGTLIYLGFIKGTLIYLGYIKGTLYFNPQRAGFLKIY